ncbi:YraN family protein [Sodalis ligni]|uniref:YraN family protein n=1 Tax=Sodalis ligni TaxID=2697027 RepID=UPI00193F7C57|nr:YraN family protein [Sodalis ligni]QWA11832.1 YraN family protein [Sodalis ligni]
MAEISTGTNHADYVNRQQAGARAEDRARRHLENAGLRFIAANMRVRGGEIDLIMKDQHTWVFVEVRYRRDNAFGNAAESVTPRKQRRLLLAAAVWLSRQGGSLDTSACRFDILAITGNRLEWLQNAFGASG